MTARKRDREGIDLDIATFRDEKVGEADGQTGDIVQEEQEVNVEETDHQKKTLPKGSGRIWKTALWSVLVIGVIPLLSISSFYRNMAHSWSAAVNISSKRSAH